MLSVGLTADAEGLQRYRLQVELDEAAAALDSFWRILSAVRAFRQLGTAQAVAVYTGIFAGVLAGGMSWADALDAALADTLADHRGRDGRRVLRCSGAACPRGPVAARGLPLHH